MEVRRYEERDGGAVGELIEVAHRADPELGEMATHLHGADREPPAWRRCLVATEDGTVVGVATALLSRAHPGSVPVGVVVRPECRGRGIGSALLAAVRAAVAGFGPAPMWSTLDGREPAAVRFAAAHGFRTVMQYAVWHVDPTAARLPPAALPPAAQPSTPQPPAAHPSTPQPTAAPQRPTAQPPSVPLEPSALPEPSSPLAPLVSPAPSVPLVALPDVEPETVLDALTAVVEWAHRDVPEIAPTPREMLRTRTLPMLLPGSGILALADGRPVGMAALLDIGTGPLALICGAQPDRPDAAALTAALLARPLATAADLGRSVTAEAPAGTPLVAVLADLHARRTNDRRVVRETGRPPA